MKDDDYHTRVRRAASVEHGGLAVGTDCVKEILRIVYPSRNDLIIESALPGTLRVEISRPPLRFGYGLHVLSETASGHVTHHAVGVEESELLFEKYDYRREASPLLMVSEALFPVLHSALANNPAAYRAQEDVRAHLGDAIGVRDRMLAMVESRFK